MKIAYQNDEDALATYFKYHLTKLKIGLVIAITGNETFKTGAGKCLHPYTLITTNKGQKEIKDIKLNDQVLGIDPTGEIAFGKVTHKWQKQNRLLEVHTQSEKILCSPDHKFLTEKGWKCAKDLKTNDVVINIQEWYDEKMDSNRTRETERISSQTSDFSRNERNISRAKESKNLFKIVCLEEIRSWNKTIDKTALEKEEYLAKRTLIGRKELYGWFHRWGRIDQYNDQSQEDKRNKIKTTNYNIEHGFTNNGMVQDIPRYANKNTENARNKNKQNTIPISYYWELPSPLVFGENRRIFESKSNPEIISNGLYRTQGKRLLWEGIYAKRNRIAVGNKKVQLIREKITKIKRKVGKSRTYDITTTIGNYIANNIVVHNSHSAVQLARQIDPTFNIKKIIYEPSQFLEALDEVNRVGKAGQVIVVDEGGVLANPQDYHSYISKAIVLTLQTFRTLNCMAIFCMPSFEDVDKRIRRLISHHGWCEKNVETGNYVRVYLRMYRLQSNMFKDDGKVRKSPIQMYSQERKKLVTFQKFLVAKLPKKVADEYEEYSDKFKTELRASLKRDVDNLMKRDGSKEINVDEIIKKIKDDRSLYETLLSSRRKLSEEAIKRKFGLNNPDAKYIKLEVDKVIQE